eukprot:m.333678 g.333678  ORF g.333678 m.333678 type:complete len:398 (-) comp17195_c0_seq1:77-1270(-)
MFKRVAIAIVVASIAITSAQDFFGPGDEIDPLAQQDAYEEWGPVLGNASNVTNATAFLDFAYYTSEKNNNTECIISRPGDNARYMRLFESLDCAEMPNTGYDPDTRYDSQFYYKLSLDAHSGHMHYMQAFCLDAECGDCVVDKYGEDIGDLQCTATNIPVDGYMNSFFIRPMPKGPEDDSVCVVTYTNEDDDVTGALTILEYASDAAECVIENTSSIKVFTTAILTSPGTCEMSSDGDYYMLQLDNATNEVSGVLFCNDSLCSDPDTCQPINNLVLNTCQDGLKIVDSSTIGQKSAVDSDSIPICNGLAPIPADSSSSSASSSSSSGSTSISMSQAMSTTAPGNKSHKKKGKGAAVGAAIGSLIVAGGLGYLVFIILRRRKLRRMNAYAALQDDPTF